MPASKQPRRPRGIARLLSLGLRRTCVHALNLLLYLLMALLALVAGLLAYLLTRDDIPLPGFAIRHIESRLARAGIDVAFASARLDLEGRLLVQDLRLSPRRFGETVIHAGMVYLDFDELFLAAGMVELSEAHAENITVYCPSALSPSGAPMPLLHLAGLSVERTGRAWTLHGALARTGTLQLAVHGTLTPPTRRERPTPPTPAELINHFAQLAPRLARALHPLQEWQGPIAGISFDVSREGEIHVALEAAAAAWARPDIGEAREVWLRARATYADGQLRPFEAQAGAAVFVARDGIRVEHPALAARWLGATPLDRPLPTRVDASAARVVHPKATVGPVVLHAATRSLPAIEGTLAIDVAGEAIELQVAGDLAARSGIAQARGRFGSTWLAEASRILGRDVAYYASIETPPDFSARAEVAEGGRLRSAAFRALTGPITARGVALDRARVHGVADLERVHIDHLEIERGEGRAIGVYDDEFATRQRRLVLHGAMQPLAISGWFSGWWEKFWNDFTFAEAPRFDIDVSGNWNIRGSDVVIGRGRAGPGAMRGIGWQSFDTRFHVRENFYDLHDATIERAEGRVEGSVRLQFRRGQRDAARTDFDFRSTADLVELARIFGPGGEALLEPYRYTTPPATHVVGAVANDAGDFDTRLHITIETPAEFRYHDFPVASLSTDVAIHNTHVHIPRLAAGYAGGTLRAVATADAGILDLSASLDNALYDDATGIFNAFLDRRSPPPPEEADPAGLAARPPGGRLSLAVEARGPITTFDAYEGTGSLRIVEANLGSVRIFGLLSNLMGTINPRLGSLTFNEANSTFSIRRDRVFFPDMRITGRTAALETDGTYYINSKNLDFRARLYPLGESGGAITQLFDFVLGPVSYLLELRLTGTLRKPNWALSRMPFAPKPVIDEGTPSDAAAAPAAPPATAAPPAPPPPAAAP